MHSDSNQQLALPCWDYKLHVLTIAPSLPSLFHHKIGLNVSDSWQLKKTQPFFTATKGILSRQHLHNFLLRSRTLVTGSARSARGKAGPGQSYSLSPIGGDWAYFALVLAGSIVPFALFHAFKKHAQLETIRTS